MQTSAARASPADRGRRRTPWRRRLERCFADLDVGHVGESAANASPVERVRRSWSGCSPNPATPALSPTGSGLPRPRTGLEGACRKNLPERSSIETGG
jgi:hypothetical protein